VRLEARAISGLAGLDPALLAPEHQQIGAPQVVSREHGVRAPTTHRAD